MSNAGRTIAEELSEFALNLRAQDVPAGVIAKAKISLLDQLAAQIACADFPSSNAVQRYAFSLSAPGPSSVVGTGRKTDAELAALTNGTAGHGFEIDDYHPRSLAHPGVVAAAPAVAVAEEVGASGTEIILAMLLGMEVSSRIGVAGTSSIIYERGFHPVSAVGPFASVIVAGRLLGLSAPLLVNAISIAASHAGGTTEYSQSGGNVKRLHAGIACAAGVRSARLARAGLTGPATIIEGRRGFLSAFSSRPDAELVREGLGVNWEVEGLAIKPYSCCAMIHAPIGAIRQILDAEEIRPSDIAKVHVSSNRLAKVHVGSVGPRPTTVEGAQFSMEFSVALALAGRGNDPAAYLEAQRTNFEDPIVRSIAERVELDVGEEPDAAFPEHFMADVELQMKDGRKRHARAYAKGTEDDPMSGEETEEKVRAMLIGRGVERDLVEQLIIFIGRIESFEDPSHLTYILQYAVPRSD